MASCHAMLITRPGQNSISESKTAEQKFNMARKRKAEGQDELYEPAHPYEVDKLLKQPKKENKAATETTADADQQLKDLEDLTSDQQEVYNKVQEARMKVPRFLFRAWSSYSGGDSRHNTVDAVTPSAFLVSEQPSFYKISKSELVKAAREHVFGTLFRTPFSSLSQSLSIVLKMAAHTEDNYIGIMDTTQLHSANIVLHVDDFPLVLGAGVTPADSFEYLIFGIIQGPAYKAVSFSEYLAAGLIPPGSWNLRFAPSITLETVKSIAKAYGGTFELVMATYLACVCVTKPAWKLGELLPMLATLQIPDNLDDLPATLSNIEYHGFSDTQRAVALVQRVVAIVKGKQPDPNRGERPETMSGSAPLAPLPEIADVPVGLPWKHYEADIKEAMSEGAAEWEAIEYAKTQATKRFLASKEVPRAVKELYTELDGDWLVAMWETEQKKL